MSGVNLSRRPFVNRRPVLRLAILLWLVGAALLFVNVSLFGGHFRGSATLRQRLDAVGAEVREAQEQLGRLGSEVDKVNVGQQNGQTVFLNSLIEYRRFPWSALFEDLEDVLPLEVRLLSVSPAVRLVVQPEKPRRRVRRRRSSARNEAPPPPPPPKDSARSNEVQLKLSGVARNEDAMLEFIDILYDSDSFRNPFLPGETTLDDGTVSFSIDVLYLTRRGSLSVEDSVKEMETAIDDEPLVAEEGGQGAASSVTASQEPEAGVPAGASVEPLDPRPGTSASGSGVAQAGVPRGESVGSSAVADEAPPSRPGSVTPGSVTEREESSARGETEPRRRGERRRSERQRPAAGSAPPADGVPPGSVPAVVPLPGEDPVFTLPPASATPQLRQGALLGTPSAADGSWGVLA